MYKIDLMSNILIVTVMQRSFRSLIASVCILTAVILSVSVESSACTSAIVSAKASASGRPMLWKHRDTSATDNVVEYVPSCEGALGYVALFNAADKNLEEAWIGMNEKGFAVMNTASYNIKDDNVPEKQMDREGFLMTMALKSCHTVEDFARLLDTLPRPMGVEANFAAIDATGAGAFFETNNHAYVRYDLDDDSDGVIVRTNYSHSGRKDVGYGYIREANAEHLLARAAEDGAGVTPELLTEVLSRSFYHDLRGEDALEGNERWTVDMDYIPRYKSTATVVIEGCIPVGMVETEAPDAVTGEMKTVMRPDVTSGYVRSQYIMWTGLGYPPCAEIVPVWCHPDGVNPELRRLSAHGTSRMCDKVKQRRAEVFSLRGGHDTNYLDLSKLKNEYGTGYIQTLVPQNMKVYRLISAKRDAGEIHFPEPSRQYKK